MISPKQLMKHAIRASGYRVVDASRRWGVDVLDDLTRMIGDPSQLSLIFDVGANVGQSSLRFVKHFPQARSLAFEPVSSTFRLLKKNVAGNNAIEPINCAMGPEVGQAEISLYGDSGKSSLLGELHDDFHKNASIHETIQVDTIDHFLAERRIDHVDLLKSDTEGFDIDVLRGASTALAAHKIDFIYTEFHHLRPPQASNGARALGSLYELADLLCSLGYRFITTYTDSVYDADDMGTYNALFMASSLNYTWRP
jgi:FkbM family methyltransferase